MKYLTLAPTIFSCLLASPAMAYDWAMPHVAMVEPTYMPSHVVFVADAGAGSCPAGANLTWFAQRADVASKSANAQAVLSVLMTAKSTNSKIVIHVNNVGCSVEFIHLI